jgi:hypothetical protein
MGCGCRKRKSNDARTASDTNVGSYQVWLNGSFTGRSFASVSQAQDYASRIGGEVRTA